MSDRKPSVMFVDDDEQALIALRRVFIDEPYHVHMHLDPHRALAHVEFNPPDVVVADYMMPGMSGPEFLHKVMNLHAGIVRIVLTGKSGLMKTLCALNDGQIYRFMIKPWNDDELRKAIRNALDYADLNRAGGHR